MVKLVLKVDFDIGELSPLLSSPQIRQINYAVPYAEVASGVGAMSTRWSRMTPVINFSKTNLDWQNRGPDKGFILRVT